MNTDEQAEIEAEIEVLELLQKSCRALRSNRNRPILAGPASRLEVQFSNRLDELHRSMTPELPLKSKAA